MSRSDPIYTIYTVDDLLYGELKLVQKKAGARYSVDALLLADFILPEIQPGHKILDIGTGTGVVALILAQRSKAHQIIGIEIQETLAQMAKRSVEINRLQKRVKILNRDVRKASKIFKPSSFDIIVCNPPFRKKGAGILSQNQERSIARYELTLTMAGLLKICRSLVKSKGKVALIYPFERLKELVAELAKSKLNPSRLKLVFHKKGHPIPILFCMELVKARTRLLLKPPCYIETEKGRFHIDRDR